MMDFLYALLKFLNDVNAIQKNKVPTRVGRRIYGKATGRLAGRIFR